MEFRAMKEVLAVGGSKGRETDGRGEKTEEG
jgi:hypothetical protein